MSLVDWPSYVTIIGFAVKLAIAICKCSQSLLNKKDKSVLKIKSSKLGDYGCELSHAEVLNVLRPHQDLTYLEVKYYQGCSVPHWMMSLQHLTHFTLWLFNYCESLPPLGKLPYLEVLNIGNMKRVEKVGVELLGIEETQTSPAIVFPKLKQLSFSDMFKWKEWEGVGADFEVTIMPCLSSLYILNAPFLKQLPDFLHYRPLLQLDMREELRHWI
ncbi:hypothetical protein M0R45_031629 [Rubus argutus]|uniref:R13L1/DRL21-like LRR repeat region domain-containing protein n=1 Tax=Rubus argutus TaxID=59490 RepID=A0AAW1WF11_RUBAR